MPFEADIRAYCLVMQSGLEADSGLSRPKSSAAHAGQGASYCAHSQFNFARSTSEQKKPNDACFVQKSSSFVILSS